MGELRSISALNSVVKSEGIAVPPIRHENDRLALQPQFSFAETRNENKQKTGTEKAGSDTF